MIRYRPLNLYKYQLVDAVEHPLELRPAEDIVTSFVLLSAGGLLWQMSGYAWDGASGPARDTPSIMRGSLVYDGLYQLLRLGLLPQEMRKEADLAFYPINREYGKMAKLRAWYTYRAVRMFAGKAALPSKDPQNQVRTAP